MPYVIRDEGQVLQGDDGKEPVFHTYEEAEETLKTLLYRSFRNILDQNHLHQKQ